MGRSRVLVIDDDLSLLRLLRRALEKAEFDVSLASNGAEGLKELYQCKPDIVLLDVMMPRMDGWEVCRRIRELSDVPILMLTAKSEEEDKVRGFRLGVDDYVTKPFSFAELTARIEAVLHRASDRSPIGKPRIYSGKGLLLDVAGHRVTLNENRVELTPTEFRLLAALAEGNGQVIPTERLLQVVWGDEYLGEFEHVKRYVWRLRSKIEKDPRKPELVLTERGIGYRLALEE
jgi:two-component system KDP operon response regulator KdpE